MKTSCNILKVARYAQEALRACFIIFIVLYLSKGIFPENSDHFDMEAIESSENHGTETEDESEGNKKETEQDDHLKFFYGYGYSFFFDIQLNEGDFFIAGSSYLQNSTPPPEQV
jgi:hypothetical protein